MAAIKWFDLKSSGYFIGAEKVSGAPRILLLDVDEKADDKKLLAAGFIRMQGKSSAYERGLYYLEREDQRVKGAELALALGITNCPMVLKERDEIALEFRTAYKQKIGKNLETALQQSTGLGYNKDANPVFESSMGRLIRKREDDGSIFVVAADSKAGQALSPGLFLYADDAQSLAECADGFFMDVRNGVRTNWKDLERAAGTAYERHLVDGAVSDLQLRDFQEAIEAAGYRAFSQLISNKIDKQSFMVAEDYYNGLPIARIRSAESIALQQYSTPLPMGVVAQRLLVGNDEFLGKTVLEPTAGNGGLITLVSKKARVFSIEIDSKRAEVLKSTLCEKVVAGDAIELGYRKTFDQLDGFDYTITNPPFGGMDRDRSFDKLPRVRRADLYIALKTLEARKSIGRSVLILGADEIRNPGAISGGSKQFMEYVYDHYHVLGVTELDGRMYAKQGASANVRLYVVGNKRDIPLINAEIPESLGVIRSYPEVWDWAEGIVQSYGSTNLATRMSEMLDQPDGVNEEIKPISVTATMLTPQVISMPAVEMTAPEVVQAHSQQAIATAKKDDVNEEPERKVNEYQAPYQSASKIGASTGMVPINLAGATYAALEDLEGRFGQIDNYVAQKLQFNKEDLGNYFSPEQIDAIGLAISKMDEGRAFTNSDFTGFGKGRFCAAMLRYTKLQGKMPVFLTLKPELFTDIFRDLKDIDSDHMFTKPFIFNDGVRIMEFGSTKNVLHPATRPGTRKATLDSGALPEGTDAVFATYSQFARSGSVNRKARLLHEIASESTAFIVDEAHVAAGKSNTGITISEALDKTSSVVFASATPFKGVANFSVYGRMFPKSVDLENLPETLKSGGEALMEAISSNMARDGVFIRRELDLSKLEFAAREPTSERTQLNRQISDKVAEILATMAYMAGSVKNEVGEINKNLKKEFESIPSSEREGNRMQASSMNFGSRLYQINRQFLLSLVIDEAAAAAVEALQQGRKPVIAVENTGESLLREVLARRAGVHELMDELDEIKENPGDDKASSRDREIELKQQIDSQLASVKLDTTPQFRDLLEVMLDRVGTIKTMKRYGVYETSRPASEGYEDLEEKVRDLIRALPDMPLSPLDVINQRLREFGYEPTEVSGRTISLHKDLIDGKWAPMTHKKADAVVNVAGYQNGSFDCITITRSGSTGISLHATNRFNDSDIRQREFIVAQKAANIAEFLQWMGRVNRRDQVCTPIMRTIETGLPAEARLTMMHNAKLRKLSANTTSNRDNSNIKDEGLDLLNELGDEIALDWLTENPSWARQLDITLPKDDDSLEGRSEDCPYINKLMGRLVMIPVAKQEEVINILSQRFSDKLEELEQRGINPFKVDVYDWKARVVSKEVLVSPSLDVTTSTFDEPVNIVKLNYHEEVIPIRENKLIEMIELGLNHYSEDFGIGEEGASNRLKFTNALTTQAKLFITKQLPDELNKAVIEKTISLSEALSDEKANAAKRANIRMTYLLKNWSSMVPGAMVEFDDTINGSLKGYVVGVSLPKNSYELTSLGEYRMRVIFPGQSRPKAISLATLFNQDKSMLDYQAFRIYPDKLNFGIENWIKKQFTDFIAAYNDAPDGTVLRSATVLSGNIFRSVELASNNNLGNPILYTDELGNRQRGVLLKSHIAPEKIKSMPMGMNVWDAIKYIDAVELKLNSSPEMKYSRCADIHIFNTPIMNDPSKGRITIYPHSGNYYVMRLPGIKSVSGKLLSDGRIFDLGAKSDDQSLNLQLTGNRKVMSCKFEDTKLRPLLENLALRGHINKFYIRNVDMDIVKDLQEKSRAALLHSRSNESPGLN